MTNARRVFPCARRAALWLLFLLAADHAAATTAWLEAFASNELDGQRWQRTQEGDARAPVAEIVLQHHELLDGSGYPRGLKGEEILQEARVLAVANVVGAMTAPRAHIAAVDIDTALAEITRLRGSKFDAQAVDACLRLFRERGYALEKR